MRNLATNSTAFPARRFKGLLSLFLAVAFMFTLFGAGTLSARADDDPGKTLTQSASDYGVTDDQKNTTQGFSDLIDKSSSDESRDNFGFVLRRLFGVGVYLNHTENGTPASGMSNPKVNCDSNNLYSGTPIYHNCDVPNLMTEFAQTLTSLIIPTGPRNAQTEAAKVALGFGVPSNLPGDGTVPVNPGNRSSKYTGLELYGYSLRFSSYSGEWDNIKTMSSARALSNFGIMDGLRLGANVVFHGVKQGMTQGAKDSWNKLKKGHVIGAIGAFYTGFFKGSVTATINTIVDTSDLNVFNTWGWYRVGYPETLYNARQMSQEEMSDAIARQFVLALMKMSGGVKGTAPQELVNAKSGPPDPQEAIASCAYTPTGGQTVTLSKSTDVPPGTNLSDCKEDVAGKVADPNSVKIEWKVDGTQKQEKLADWKNRANVKSILDVASKYGIDCTMDTSSDAIKDASKQSDARKTAILNFKSCWTEKWPEAAQQATLKDTQSKNDNVVTNLLMRSGLLSVLTPKGAGNFNSPWSRYVCLDSSGNDIRTNEGELTKLYIVGKDGSKTLNPACPMGAVRPPIQNGYYGNGYDAGAAPAPDTRWTALGHYSLFDAVLQAPSVFGTGMMVANGALSVTKVFTKAMVTLVDLSYSPILDKLGIRPIIMTLINSFRDSVFFPFTALVIAAAALQIFVRTLRQRSYSRGFYDIFLVLATFFVGVMLLTQTQKVMDVADNVPSQVETLIVGAIMHVDSSGTEVCTATTQSDFNANAEARSMECKVWQVFLFNPWVSGQWNTSYANLYANGTTTPSDGSTMTNSNGSLVGTADVNMGGNTVVHNWALYQLDVTTSGTSTTDDVKANNGQVSTNFYRLVDLQAGPNGGAASDKRFFDDWRGAHPGHRDGVAIMSVGVAAYGLVVVFGITIMKIFITITFALMFLFMPFMLLIGLHPTVGRAKMRNYFMTMLSLCVQRVLLVVLLALMLLIMTAVAGNISNFMMQAVVLVVILLAFHHNRAELLRMFGLQASGNFMGVNLTDPATTLRAMPPSVKNLAYGVRGMVIGTAGGVAAGVTTGNYEAIPSYVRDNVKDFRRRNLIRERKAGTVGLFTSQRQAIEMGKKSNYNRDAEQERFDLVRDQVERDFNTPAPVTSEGAALAALTKEMNIGARERLRANEAKVKDAVRDEDGNIISPLKDKELYDALITKRDAEVEEDEAAKGKGVAKSEDNTTEAAPRVSVDMGDARSAELVRKYRNLMVDLRKIEEGHSFKDRTYRNRLGRKLKDPTMTSETLSEHSIEHNLLQHEFDQQEKNRILREQQAIADELLFRSDPTVDYRRSRQNQIDAAELEGEDDPIVVPEVSNAEATKMDLRAIRHYQGVMVQKTTDTVQTHTKKITTKVTETKDSATEALKTAAAEATQNAADAAAEKARKVRDRVNDHFDDPDEVDDQTDNEDDDEQGEEDQ